MNQTRVPPSQRAAREFTAYANMNKTHTTIPSSNDTPDFSLVMGGPLYQLLVRARLATPAFDLVRRRILCITTFAWLPLLLLSLVSGKAWGGGGLTFLSDLEMHERFLVALPLLIGAELLVHRRLRFVVAQFVERNIITEAVLPRFNAAIASAMKLRNSVAIELILFVLIFIVGHYVWTMASVVGKIGTGAGTWYATGTDGHTQLHPAGYWYVFVSRPLFQFILVRWYFRLFLWARFLWQCSRMELNLIPLHPDRAAGLGFLGGSSAVFAPLLTAHGALVAGVIANPIFFAGAKFTDFRLEILGGGLLLLLIVLGPMLAFSANLMRAKRAASREYGLLASRYASEFDRKWLHGGAPADEKLLGNSDIQSLADLGNSFQVIPAIQAFPFGRSTVIELAVFYLIPVLPLVLTMIPLEELIKRVFGLFFDTSGL